MSCTAASKVIVSSWFQFGGLYYKSKITQHWALILLSLEPSINVNDNWDSPSFYNTDHCSQSEEMFNISLWSLS